MTSWSQGNSFTAAPGLPFINKYVTLNKKRVSTKYEQKTVTLTKRRKIYEDEIRVSKLRSSNGSQWM
jgi:hypothetical protein